MTPTEESPTPSRRGRSHHPPSRWPTLNLHHTPKPPKEQVAPERPFSEKSNHPKGKDPKVLTLRYPPQAHSGSLTKAQSINSSSGLPAFCPPLLIMETTELPGR